MSNIVADAIARELPFLRCESEARMQSRVTIYRATSRTVQDESTGAEVPVWTITHTGLPARFPPERGGAGKSRTLDVGGVEVTVALREMHVPWLTDDMQAGDLALVTVGRSAGAVWRIVDGSAPGDQATAYRLDVIQDDARGEW